MNITAARELARANWPVFPTREKMPLTPNGFKNATTDEKIVEDWWTTYPDAQIAIAIPPGRVVIDIDTPDGTDKHPADGFATLAALETQHGPLPPTLTSISGRGGEHRWFALPLGAPPLVQRNLGPGIQTRVAGKGYVVAPPSIHHETGQPYAWRVAPVAEAPTWLIEALREKAVEAPTGSNGWPVPTAEGLTAARGWLENASPSVQGQNGSASLMKAAGVLVRGFALGPELGWHLLREYNETKAEPAWPEHNIARAIESAKNSTREPAVGSMLADTSLLDALRVGAGASPGVAGFDIRGIDDIFAPLPPIAYLVNGIGVTPGAPILIAGYGFSGKTAAVQQLAVNLARPEPADRQWMNPRPVWDKFAGAKRCRVLHVDYEQAHNLTFRRYQRLALAAGVTKEDLRGYLAVVSMPRLYLNTAAGIAELDKQCGAFDLVIIDSFIAACPGLEENSSNARESLDALTRISDHHGCAFIVIHHARKPSTDKPGGPKMAIRGSGAIFDACSSVLVFDGEKDQPKHVSHEKERSCGVTTDDFELEIVDEKGGLLVRAKDIVVKTAAEKSNEELDIDKTAMLGWLTENLFFKNRDQIAKALGISKTRASAAIGALETSGELIQSGSYRDRTYHLSGKAPGMNGAAT